MKEISIDDTVYYEEFGHTSEGTVLQLLTDKGEITGKDHPVALVKLLDNNRVTHCVVETRHLTYDSTEYDKQQERDRLIDKINQLKERLKNL